MKVVGKSEGVYVGISKHNLEFQKLEEIAQLQLSIGI